MVVTTVQGRIMRHKNLRTPACCWCFWAPLVNKWKLYYLGGMEAVNAHRTVALILGSGRRGVYVVRMNFFCVVLRIDKGVQYLGAYLSRSRALYQRARWATEFNYECTVFDCRQPE